MELIDCHKHACLIWCHDTQHNDTQNNDIQHNGTQHNDIQHSDSQHIWLFVTLSLNNTQHNDTQHNSIVVMLNVIKLSVVMLNVINPELHITDYLDNLSLL